MFLVTRTTSFAQLFFLLSMCGLITYVVLAFYTFHLAFKAVSKSESIIKVKETSLPNIRVKEEGGFLLKNILLWTIPDFQYNLTRGGQHIFIDNNCEQNNCFLTTNKKLLNNVKEFDAIVFSINTLRKWKKYFPKERSVTQKYVFYSMTPSSRYPVCSIMADNFFNWTWTYKLYSDILTPFIEVKDMNGVVVAPSFEVEWPTEFVSLDTHQKVKPKAIMWYSDNCDDLQAKTYVKELQKNLKELSMELDIYGCGDKCPNGDCLKGVEDDYTFHLIFEDSITEDYLTTNVLRAFHHKAVPVIISGVDLSKFLPPYSYINARYESPEKLAGLLEYIHRSPDTYNKYFSWTKHYTISEKKIQEGYCQLCALLNDNTRTQSFSSYDTFRRWWYYGNLQEKCYPKGAERYDDVLSYIDDKATRKLYMP